MPENHDHSKYVAVESHYEGHRRDINDLDLKAYIDARIAAAGGGGSSYLVYTALLTQSGTDAPVANVLENTLGGTVVWARDNAGSYTATLSNAFTANKTFLGPKVQYKSPTIVDDEFININRDSASQIRIDHFVAGEQVDVLTNIPIKIEVYP